VFSLNREWGSEQYLHKLVGRLTVLYRFCAPLLPNTQLLGRHGYEVFATMRDIARRNAKHRAALEALASKEKLSIEVVEMDVSEDDSVSAAIEQILERTGRIDILINNAGVTVLGITEAYTLEQVKKLFEVNVFGVMRVTRSVLPTMRRQRSGLLIPIALVAIAD
jgi:NAD(P)-dependent dehydrogenase (short-subunit alcohol dehydrogenase family)